VFVSASVVLEAANCIVDISRAELVELLVVPKYDDRYVDLAENSQLECLLEQTTFSLEERDGSVPVILDRFDLNLSATHGWM